MLNSHLFAPKTIDDFMEEAKMQIPLYTEEWTNFNDSDPAITVLETMSAVTILQQESIDTMPDSVREKLFEMAGFRRRNGKSARVLLETTNVPENIVIPAGQKFKVGGMSFETNHETNISGHKLTGLFRVFDEKTEDMSYVLDPDMPIKASIFTDDPKTDMAFYMVADSFGNPGEEVIFYFKMDEPFERNPIGETQPFAELQWQTYTKNGFVDIRVKDMTEGLLRSGEVKVRLPRQKLEIYGGLPTEGYVIRAVLKKADYDIPPRIEAISGFLMEVWQKDTKSVCYTFPCTDSLEVYSDILEDGYWRIYAKEEDGRYHMYEMGNVGDKGRFYTAERTGFGDYIFRFDRESFGYGPGDYINAIKLVAYNEELMQRYSLGTVLGYEGQKMKLPMENIVGDTFSVIAERIDENGEKIYDFIKPDSDRPEDFHYTISEPDGELKIRYAGDYVGADLYVCSCAKTDGRDGNVRRGSIFTPVGYSNAITFTNPADGSGGCLCESLKDLRERFIRDVNEHYTAVEASDYERIVRSTPGLCIHKVRAFMNREKNQVQIAVKPYSSEQLPQFSDVYRDAIMKRIESRRLLTTSVELIQPVYCPVAARGTVYVKPHFEKCLEKIEAVIRRELDYINGDSNFGEVINFDELFHKIEQLECVDFIYELSIVPEKLQYASRQGLDIVPMGNCLIIPGEINIVINSIE